MSYTRTFNRGVITSGDVGSNQDVVVEFTYSFDFEKDGFSVTVESQVSVDTSDSANLFPASSVTDAQLEQLVASHTENFDGFIEVNEKLVQRRIDSA